ncbi:cytochrome P450 4C1-like [Pararge aegeria]|uniref:Jg6227 protein n=1 Tax=Pararge aegeria aegeria TaxID=348720 RepID=A0A8S4R9C5_9NEOP|nr:cytochrome P450 4C1-like [Pararge aegeria]CAH2233297.1 jg6227 [Pararge aegeria aegeria]
MLFLCLLVLLLVLLVIVSVKIRSKKLIELHRQIKVNFPYVPVIGHAYKFIGTNEDRMLMFDELGRQAHCNPYGLASFWLAHYLCVSISDPVCASAVLKTFSDKWPVTLSMRHLLGNGSVFAEAEIWRLRRKILIPVFNSKYCDNFVKVFERNNEVLIEKLAAVVGQGDISMWPFFSSYTLDSAFGMTFGENVNAQKDPNHPFAKAFQDYFRNMAVRVCQPWLFSAALYELLPAGRRQERNRRVLWDYLDDIITKKKRKISAEKLENELEHHRQNTVNNNFKSFLDLLIEFSGGEDGYTDTELREETIVLILAATDTSATTLSIAAVLLANHPRVQDKVYEELQEVLGDSERCLDNLAKLKYLDAVVKETLRLYPPAPVTVRRCDKDLELPSGLVLNNGCYFLLNFWSIHRNPHCWGADADEFRPERFLSVTPQQLSAFMPFGHGPRSCTGFSLALTSIKLSLAETLRRFRVAPGAGYACGARAPLRVTFDIMLKHVHNFEVQLERR